MSDKIARLGIERDNDLMYYIKDGDVWATPRKQKGLPKGKARKVAETDLELDYGRYLYFLDSDGDVARKERASGGRRTKKTKSNGTKSNGTRPNGTKAVGTTRTPRSSKRGGRRTAVSSAASESTTDGRGRKSEAQLEREIQECIARAKNGTSVNGSESTTAGARMRRGRRGRY